MKKSFSKQSSKLIPSEKGKIGYLIAWFMGVPASILILIFLIRGH
jgi:hypothetical protein